MRERGALLPGEASPKLRGHDGGPRSALRTTGLGHGWGGGVPWDSWADGSVRGAHQELTPGLALPTREGAGGRGQLGMWPLCPLQQAVLE